VPKQGNLNANGKKVLEYVLQEHKNGLPITWQTILIKALASIMKIPRQDLKSSNEQAVRYVIKP
jgi:hypothetical protein